MKNKSKKIGICPQCDAEVRFKKPPQVGQSVNCRDCGSRLEVVAIGPVELDWPSNVGYAEADDKKVSKQRRRMRQQKQKNQDWENE